MCDIESRNAGRVRQFCSLYYVRVLKYLYSVEICDIAVKNWSHESKYRYADWYIFLITFLKTRTDTIEKIRISIRKSNIILRVGTR